MPGRALFGGLFAGGMLWSLFACALALRGSSRPQELYLVAAGVVFSALAGGLALAVRGGASGGRRLVAFGLGLALAGGVAALTVSRLAGSRPPLHAEEPPSPTVHPGDPFESRRVPPAPDLADVRIGADLMLDRQTRRVRGRADHPFRADVTPETVRMMFGVAPIESGGRVVVEWLGSSPRTLWSGDFAASGAWLRWQDVTLDLPRESGALEIRVEATRGSGTPNGSDVLISEPALLRSTRGLRPVNLVLVSIDTLRADMLGSYGYERFPTSPTLDELAARGTSFANAFAPSPWTVPSHMGIFTGIQPDALGMARLIGGTPRLDPRRRTLAELFQEAGYLTVAFTGTATIAARHGFSDGFYLQQEAYNDDETLQRDADTNLYLALDWLGEHRQEPMFLFFHTFEPHNPYVHRRFVAPNLEGDEARSAAYASGIGYTDDQIGRLVEQLDRMGLLRDSILVVTSDHGEGLGAMPRLYHGRTLYDEVLHVPLILVGEGVPEGRRIQPQVPLIDLFATLAELYGLTPPDDIDSRSLWPLVRGESHEERPVHLCCLAHRGQMRGLRRDGYKFLMMPRRDGGFDEELYHLSADPGEKANLARVRGEIAASMRAEVLETARRNGARATGAGAPEHVDEAFESQLRALGYVD